MPALPSPDTSALSSCRAHTKLSSKRRKSGARRLIDSEAEGSGPECDHEGEDDSDDEEALAELNRNMINDESSEDETLALPKLSRREKRLSKGDMELVQEAAAPQPASPVRRSRLAPSEPIEWESSNSEYDSDFVEKDEEDREAEALARKARQLRRQQGVFCRGDPQPSREGKNKFLVLDMKSRHSLYLSDPSTGELRDACTGEVVKQAGSQQAESQQQQQQQQAVRAKRALEDQEVYRETCEYLRSHKNFAKAELAAACDPRKMELERSGAPAVKKLRQGDCHLPPCLYSGIPTKTAPVFSQPHKAPKSGPKKAKEQPREGVYRDNDSGQLYFKHKDGRRSPR